jgi:hypothetical protein
MTHTDDPTRCTYTTADGRRCRMPRTDPHVTLCGTHLEAQQRRVRTQPTSLVHDVLAGTSDLASATAVNHVLGNLTGLLVDNRIDPRKALVLAYLCQLLLQTINIAERERTNPVASP